MTYQRGYRPRLAVRREWRNPSSSSPGTSYTTILWEDQTISCNCPGWTRRVAADGTRDCKHCREAERELNEERRTLKRVTKVQRLVTTQITETVVTTVEAPSGRRRVFLVED